MRRRSFLAGLLAVPVAVACDPRGVSQVPVSPGSSGGTTVADLATPDGWHYVGEAGEAAWAQDGGGDNWQNQFPTTANLAYRIREAGIVDVQGSIARGLGTGSDLFTLPSGYRPNSITYYTAYALTSSDDHLAVAVGVNSAGTVEIIDGKDDPFLPSTDPISTVHLQLQIFLVSSSTP